MTQERKRPKLSKQAEKRRREGSRKGARKVQKEFSGVMTRARFSELVGIHPLTAKRWQKAGVVKPKLTRVANIPTWTFTPEDVAFGKRVKSLLARNPGELSLEDAARQARSGKRS